MKQNKSIFHSILPKLKVSAEEHWSYSTQIRLSNFAKRGKILLIGTQNYIGGFKGLESIL